MIDQQLVAIVTDWFARTGGGSLCLPAGWFGRPYDNLHRLTSAGLIAGRLVIVLDGHQTLALSGPVTAVAEPATLRLAGFSQATWDWKEYGSAQPHTETFGTGEIVFVAHQ